MKIIPLGGYNEVGMNMTALVVGDEAIIFDMGLYMPKIVGYEDEMKTFTEKEMIAAGAIPDDSFFKEYKDKVIAILLGHAHLDHIGAVPYLAGKYGAPIYGTPYTLEILKKIIEDKTFKVYNKLKPLNPNGRVRLSKNIEIEFINITHSTLQTVVMAVHTKEGTVLYANDFKLDNHPVLGKKPNYERFKNLKNVKVLILDCLYSGRDGKTPSEKVAKEMLKDVLLGVENKGKAVIVTTFSSHIARLKSIAEFGKNLRRHVIFLGRSLEKYVSAAIKLKLVNFPGVEIVKYSSKVRRRIKQLSKTGRDKYLIVCTGNQAEPGSVLDRMVNGLFKFREGDQVIFSTKTIPDPVNIENRAKMEEKLKRKKIRMFTDIHVSGHNSREDLRDLVTMVKPQHIIPAHGGWDKVSPMVELAKEMGYKENKNVHLLKNRQVLEL